MTRYFTGFGQEVSQEISELFNRVEELEAENAQLKTRIVDLSSALAKARRRRRSTPPKPTPVAEIPSIE
jgi:hypothetical protein